MNIESIVSNIKELENAYDEMTNNYINRRLELLLQYKGLTGEDYEPEIRIDANVPKPTPGTKAAKIYDFLVNNGPTQTKDIADGCNFTRHAVNQVFANDRPYKKYFLKVSYGIWKAKT